MFPHLTILTRAVDRTHAYRLIRAGVATEHVHRGTLGSSLDLSVAALRLMGFRAVRAVRAAKVYRSNEEASMANLAEVFDGGRQVYVSTARQPIQNLENVLSYDLNKRFYGKEDRNWSGPPRQQEEIEPTV